MEKSLTTISYCDNLKLSLIQGEGIAGLVQQIDAEFRTSGRRTRAGSDQIRPCAGRKPRTAPCDALVECSVSAVRAGGFAAEGDEGARTRPLHVYHAPRARGLPDTVGGTAEGSGGRAQGGDSLPHQGSARISHRRRNGGPIRSARRGRPQGIG